MIIIIIIIFFKIIQILIIQINQIQIIQSFEWYSIYHYTINNKLSTCLFFSSLSWYLEAWALCWPVSSWRRVPVNRPQWQCSSPVRAAPCLAVTLSWLALAIVFPSSRRGLQQVSFMRDSFMTDVFFNSFSLITFWHFGQYPLASLFLLL